MKTKMNLIGLICMVQFSILLVGCKNEDSISTGSAAPTKQQFNALKQQALNSITQKFTINTVQNGYYKWVSAKGVTLWVPTSGFTKNGQAVTGAVDIEYVEAFDKADMILANMPTVGQGTDGTMGLLVSGGEFITKATQNGINLDVSNPIYFYVPTTSFDTQMTIWTKNTTDTTITWKDTGVKPSFSTDTLSLDVLTRYYYVVGNWGLCNLDRFYYDNRVKTKIQLSVPEGYNLSNSVLYLSIDGESAMARLDTFDNGIFSEHYGLIPVGLSCHISFISGSEDKYMWCIKSITTADTIFKIKMSEMQTGTLEQLKQALKANL